LVKVPVPMRRNLGGGVPPWLVFPGFCPLYRVFKNLHPYGVSKIYTREDGPTGLRPPFARLDEIRRVLVTVFDKNIVFYRRKLWCCATFCPSRRPFFLFCFAFKYHSSYISWCTPWKRRVLYSFGIALLETPLLYVLSCIPW